MTPVLKFRLLHAAAYSGPNVPPQPVNSWWATTKIYHSGPPQVATQDCLVNSVLLHGRMNVQFPKADVCLRTLQYEFEGDRERR